MTDTEAQVLDATIRAVSDLGMRKTSMSDIASRADVSRQTVYNLFGTKDAIFHAAIEYMGEQWRQNARKRLVKCDTLSGQLDVLIKVFAIDAFKFSHSSSFSTDMFVEAYLSAPNAIEHFIAENRKLYREVFEPYDAVLSTKNSSAKILADHFDMVCRSYIRDARSLNHLRELTSTHKELILAAVRD